MSTISKTSPDLLKERREQLKRLFPDLFTDEGQLNENELKALLSEYNTSQTERYEFRWAGKASSKKLAFTPSKATLVPDKKRSIDCDNTQNMIIEGDNLEVLKLLQKSYFNKVKCIYIDPPYNTGNDFIYSDDYSEDRKAYWEKGSVTQDGVKLDTNSESVGRYHSNWLDMMQSRLLLARNLLKDDGVIFVSIDDNEVANLRKLMDEVFGEENFVGQIIAQSNPRGSQSVKYLASVHEYLVCYVKDFNFNSIKGEALDERMRAEYKYSDKNGRKYRFLGLRQRGGAWRREDRPSLFFPIFINPNNSQVSLEKDSNFVLEVFPIKPTTGEEGSWRWSKQKIAKDIEYLVAKKINRTGQTDSWDIFEMDYLETSEGEEKNTKTKTIWDEKGINYQNAKIELKALFEGKDLFDFPKPVYLIKKVIQLLKYEEDDLILDYFAGSGTTGEAVMELNKEDGGNRKFILVQLPELTDINTEAYKAGFKTISDICIERVKRAGEKIKKESDKIDTGFKVFQLTYSHFPENLFTPDPDKSEEENIQAFNKYLDRVTQQVTFDFEDDYLLYEIALKDGFNLNFKIESLPEFDNNKVLRIKDGDKEALVCLDQTISDKTVELLQSYKAQRFICLKRAVDTTKKWNLQQLFEKNLWVA